MKTRLLELYLDWVNNFLTVARFAEYYGLTLGQALRVIRLGGELHERRVEKYKISQYAHRP